MTGSVNRVTLLGRVGKDPEVRSFANGGRIAQFSLATSERWRDKSSGEMKEKTEWHHVVIKNDVLVDLCEKYVNRGSQLYVEGAMQTRKWQASDGTDRYSTEVVLGPFKSQMTLLDSKADREARASGGRVDDNGEAEGARTASGGSGSYRSASGGASGYAGGSNRTTGNGDLDDEIPF